jgi:GDP-4-dehydro-6-deoxy-D-mannose reductase
VKVLVTGADGFVGRWLVRAFLSAGHAVTATTGPGATPPRISGAGDLRWVPLDVTDAAAVASVASVAVDAVVHLAALSSGSDALREPARAWEVNAVGTARLLAELGRRRAAGESDPVVLAVSTAEVYGVGPARPLVEEDPVAPRSPYAASKAAAELAATETAARTGLRVVVARPFPHTGPGQDTRFVAPAFAERLLLARRLRTRVVKVGNLEATRDILDVRDVAAAYVALVERGTPGETYNVATGTGITLAALFARLAAVVGVDAIPEPDPALVRPADLPFLVGDPGKLQAATGWRPRHDLDQTLRDLVDAQAD